MTRRTSTLVLLSGALVLAFGLFALFSPARTAVALVMLVGAFTLVDGIAQLVLAFRTPVGRGSLILSGVLSTVIGVVGLFAPAIGAAAIIWVLAAWVILRGVFSLATAGSRPAGRGLAVLSGILWILLGLILMGNPAAGAATLSVVLGFFAVVAGIMILSAGLLMRRIGTSVRQAQEQYLRQGAGRAPGAAGRRTSSLDNGDVIEGEIK